MAKKEKLEAILQRLQAGEKLACMARRGVCYMYYSFGYIHWCCFGSSAERPTIEGLRFILDKICESEDYEVMTPAELKAKTGRDWFYLF